MSNKTRFYFAKENLSELGRELSQRDFIQLPDCTRDNTPGEDKMIIDTQKETFWVLDNVCFENSAKLIQDTFDTALEEINQEAVQSL